MTFPISKKYIPQIAAQNYSVNEIKQPKGGGAQGGAQVVNPFSPEIQQPQKTKAGRSTTLAKELNDVSNIGYSKQERYKNGLGGTEHPVDANGRFCKTWVA